MGITTHVLDTARGTPAAGVDVTLERRAATGWESAGAGRTDGDGRLRTLQQGPTTPGVYRLVFDTGGYFRAHGDTGFYPFVTIAFEVGASDAHYHVPLLLSPHGYTTYRGS